METQCADFGISQDFYGERYFVGSKTTYRQGTRTMPAPSACSVKLPSARGTLPPSGSSTLFALPELTKAWRRICWRLGWAYSLAWSRLGSGK
jgi:hypothetical protein